MSSIRLLFLLLPATAFAVPNDRGERPREDATCLERTDAAVAPTSALLGCDSGPAHSLFADVCDDHQRCYEECTTGQTECDGRLLRTALEQCDEALASGATSRGRVNRYQQCRGTAWDLYEGLRADGTRWDDAQAEACDTTEVACDPACARDGRPLTVEECDEEGREIRPWYLLDGERIWNHFSPR